MSTLYSSSLDFLAPSSITVIGASDNPAKRGHSAIAHLLSDKFDGAIYPVNPRLDQLLELKCYHSIEAVPVTADLALICTPAATVPGIIERCGKQGIKGAVVLASGFSESDQQGALLEQQCVDMARKYNIRLVGPNTSGMFNTRRRCNLVGFSNLKEGPIGIISQSGNMALSLVTESLRHPTLGFSGYIGVGNEADIACHEYLHFFANDPQTRVIATYIEGFNQGQAFLETAREVAREKPIVMYKSGRTANGQSAARSHTGALAGDFQLCRGVMRQAGVILVERSDHLLPIAEALAMHPPAAGNRVAILTDGGGHATIAADELSDLGLQLATLSDTTVDSLHALLGPQAPVSNPVDFAGASDTHPELFASCSDLLLSDPGVDALLIVGLFGGYQLRFSASLADAENQAAHQLNALQKSHNKPLVVHSVYKHHRPKALVILEEEGIPVQDSLEIAVHCIDALVQYGAIRQSSSDPLSSAETALVTSADLTSLLEAHSQRGETVLTEAEGRMLLADQGIELSQSKLLTEKHQLAQVSADFNQQPLAMKVISRQIIHKSDAGGVQLNLTDSEQITAAFDKITRNAYQYDANAQIDGMLISPMAKPGIEVILGITRDAQFGPVLMFGLGGIHVELFRDVSFRALPVTRRDASEMLDEIKGSKLLDGVRGAAAIDREALINLMIRLSNVFMSHAPLNELELNPVILYEEGLEIVDVRALLLNNDEN